MWTTNSIIGNSSHFYIAYLHYKNKEHSAILLTIINNYYTAVSSVQDLQQNELSYRFSQTIIQLKITRYGALYLLHYLFYFFIIETLNMGDFFRYSIVYASELVICMILFHDKKIEQIMQQI